MVRIELINIFALSFYYNGVRVIKKRENNKMHDEKKTTIFETTAIPKATANLTIPTILSSLSME